MQKRRTASLIAITRAARRVSARSANRNAPAPERIRVVLRRDDPHARRQRPVDVGVHEVGVDEVGPQRAQRPREPEGERRIEVARRREPLVRDRQLAVEGVEHTRRVVEPDERHVDPAFGQRRQQRQQVPLGPADARGSGGRARPSRHGPGRRAAAP